MFVLNEICDVHGHLIDLRRVKLLNVSEDTNVVILDEVDRDTFPPEATRPPNTVDIQLTVIGQVVRDDKRHLWVGERVRSWVSACTRA